MHVDIRSLGRFNRMAHEGAEEAARHLSGLADVEAFVDVTKTNVTTAAGLGGTDHRVGVVVELDGGLEGRTVFTFPLESATKLANVLVPGSDGVDESAIREVGNVMAGGFIDGWADYLGTTIDIAPPDYIEGERESVLRDPAEDDALVFASQVEAVEPDLGFDIHLFPERASLQAAFDSAPLDEDTDLMARGSSDDSRGATVSIDKLSVFGGMVRQGATSVSNNLTTMTGIETAVEVTTLSFVPVEELPDDLRARTYVGVVFEFDGPPSGYVMILFDEESARDVAEALVPGERERSDGDPPESFGQMDRSAIREVGNVMASSFVDGWANSFDTTIDISPPEFVHDMGGAIVDPVAVSLGQRQQFAFVSDATIRADDRAFDCSLYALPDETELRDVLDSLDADGTAERQTKAGEL